MTNSSISTKANITFLLVIKTNATFTYDQKFCCSMAAIAKWADIPDETYIYITYRPRRQDWLLCIHWHQKHQETHLKSSQHFKALAIQKPIDHMEYNSTPDSFCFANHVDNQNLENYLFNILRNRHCEPRASNIQGVGTVHIPPLKYMFSHALASGSSSFAPIRSSSQSELKITFVISIVHILIYISATGQRNTAIRNPKART